MCHENPRQSKNGLVATPARRTEERSEATMTMRATPEPTAHAVRSSHAMRPTHRGTMMPPHRGTTIAPAAHEGESEEVTAAGQRSEDQDDDDEAQHCRVPPFV
jgi:hypothetical protein